MTLELEDALEVDVTKLFMNSLNVLVNAALLSSVRTEAVAASVVLSEPVGAS